jgi:exodeoxyribonuclease X
VIDCIVVLDTETTGLSPAEGAEICEIAWVSLTLMDGKWVFGPGHGCFIETFKPFDPAARAAHHIDPAWCQPGAPNCAPRGIIIGSMKAMERPGQMLYAAHNAPYDMAFLPELSLAVIDTYRCAKHLWPDAPQYKNQTLRYWLNAEPPAHLLDKLVPHRALYDAAVTAAILQRMLDLKTPADLVRLSTTPFLLEKVTFGKHKDEPWAKVPVGYLDWMARASDMYQNDQDIRYTVDHYRQASVQSYTI